MLNAKQLFQELTKQRKLDLHLPRIPERFRSIRSFGDFWKALAWRDIEWIAAIPSLLFFSLPFLYISLIHFTMYWMGWRHVGGAVYFICVVTGILALLLALGKWRADPSVVKVFSKQNAITAVCFLILVVLMGTSSVVNDWHMFDLVGFSFHRESLMTYISYIMIFFFPAACIRSTDIKRFIICYAVLVSFQHGLQTYLDGLGIWENYALHMSNSLNYTGIFLNTNHYGYYLTVTILLSAGMAAWFEHHSWRMLGLYSFLLQTVVLVLNNTMGCFLSSLIGLVFMAIMHRIVYRKHSHRIGLLIAAYLAVWLGTQFFTQNSLESIKEFGFDLSRLFFNNNDELEGGTGRVKLWYYTLQYIAEKPIFGYGVEGIFAQLNNEAGNTRTHNLYLECAAFFGIPAAICMITGIFCIYLNGLKRKATLDRHTMMIMAAAFAFAVSGVFGTSMFYTTPYFYLLLGLGFSVLPQQEKTTEPASSESNP